MATKRKPKVDEFGFDLIPEEGYDDDLDFDEDDDDLEQDDEDEEDDEDEDDEPPYDA